MSANAGPTLDNIKSSNAISIGYREASIPFSYPGADQKPIGLSMDLCAHVVDRLKPDLSLSDLRVNLTPVNSLNRIPLIQNGTIDIDCEGTRQQQKASGRGIIQRIDLRRPGVLVGACTKWARNA
ncbi:transporter substrate-binding domain-containing protein [Mesorhizobium sp. M0809]|uniref:transporter substrate-binding domain-containing protein n=1 Tax=Mesorhizobium sp. M0809 TaxID=2957003 RepID=UPI00333AA644